MGRMNNLNYPAERLGRGSEGQRGQQSIWTYFRFSLDICGLLLLTFWSYTIFIISFFWPPPPKSLKNDIILVTGGGNGMGRQLCLQLAPLRPAAIVSWELDEKSNNSLIAELKSMGIQKAFGYKVDVSNPEDVATAAAKVREEVGDVTMLFNNAGILGQLGKGWEINLKSVEKVYQVNTVAHAYTLREFLPAMIRRGKGHVVQTCSMIGIITGANASPYIGSKFAVHGYTESVKEDLRCLQSKPDIKFTTVYPNVTKTALIEGRNLKAGKYPFLIWDMEPQDVVSVIINGVRRNQEYIYFPGYLRVLPALIAILPPAAVRRLTDIVDMQVDI